MNRRYLITTLLTSLLLLSAHALFCWWADPYQIYRIQTGEPIPADARDRLHHLRLSKAYQLERRKPQVLILGSSRVSTLAPEVITTPDQVAYNAALPGITAYEMWSYFRHATAIHVPDRLLIGLDYETFLTDEEPFQPGFSKHRLATSPADLQGLSPLRRHYPDYGSTLFSLTASRSALAFLIGTIPGGTLLFADGTWRENGNSGRPRLSGRGGYKFIIPRYFTKLSSQRPQYDLAYLGNIIDECHRLGIDVTLYISPTHYTLATVYQRTQHLQSREQWQRDITRLLAERAVHWHARPFPLWGFENNAASREGIAPIGRASDLYQDGIHISAHFSEIILREMFAEHRQPDYGQRLDEGNIDSYLRDIRFALTDYQRINIDEMQWMTRLIGTEATASRQ